MLISILILKSVDSTTNWKGFFLSPVYKHLKCIFAYRVYSVYITCLELFMSAFCHIYMLKISRKGLPKMLRLSFSYELALTLSLLLKLLPVKLEPWFILYLYRSIIQLLTECWYLIGTHSMQHWTAITRSGVTRKRRRSTIRLKHTVNLIRKNIQLIGVC